MCYFKKKEKKNTKKKNINPLSQLWYKSKLGAIHMIQGITNFQNVQN